ncbi:MULTISPECIES: FtsH protease activity modulator HflK [Providencia]|uniref:Protein HflK n=1 Tax=Providencia alcalifaciens DSM 30120 TaxID=520999 RepID=B6XCE2_9GAMM|nr:MULTISPECIES: FtsH protease activity modulator HflK [Providencia]ATG15869.1 protease modulator HflK [Providencia alcalifaciens]EEB46892.1 HflK protein [Providencia alcalifaciens DSM 30120]EKT65222.1 FtsH protease regulator HflK [Providencia alcalifaciens Dmel2]ETT04666.1 HflK protein [Providencia alcalifaciens F90-2004]EUC97353.1 HflK protein [Providencia alcalifaciens PAL-2]
MAWNQPGNDGQDRDPWGSGNKGSNSGGNKGGRKPGAYDLDDLFRKIGSKLGGGGNKGGGEGNNKQSSPISGRLGILALAAVVVVWAGSGFYTIKESDRGVVLRFGEYSGIVGPGLNWKPTFIDQVVPVNVETVREQATNGMMLTSDENVIRVEMNVQYRVTDPAQYLFSVTNPDNSLRQALDSAVRGVIGQSAMEQVLTTNRAFIRDVTQKELEATIAPYKMGITLLDVNFQAARPPEDVKAAFDDVISAREEEQKTIREAHAYRNEVLPLAKGNAQRMIEEAEAYKASVVFKAEGEVASFAKMLPEYRAAPEITRERLYIETMERVLGNTRKVIANDKSNSMLVLPLDQIMRGTNGNVAPASKSNPSSARMTNSNNGSSSVGSAPAQPNSPVRGDAVRVGRQ